MRLFCDSEAVIFSRTGVHRICVRVIMGDIIDCDRSVQSNKLLYIITHYMTGLNHQYPIQGFMPVSFFLQQSFYQKLVIMSSMMMSVSDTSGVQATYLQALSHSTRSQAAQAEPSVTQVPRPETAEAAHQRQNRL